MTLENDEDFSVVVTVRDLHQVKQQLFAIVNYSRATANLKEGGNLTEELLDEYNAAIHDAARKANDLLGEITDKMRGVSN